MTVSPAIRAALEASRKSFEYLIGEAPRFEPKYHPAMDAGHWLHDRARWVAAETARPALEKINAALAEMEAQS